MAVQAQWNLDRTVGSAISIGLGVFRAASRDNVQPLSIYACEKFGNTVAMCQETCRKVEKLMVTPKPVHIEFLQAAVGFSPDDSGSELSKSLAGTQFLGLAAALVSSLGPFDSGNVLELLLKESTSDRTLLPTARQLRDLLESLESRCDACGFPESVAGWHIFLLNEMDGDLMRSNFRRDFLEERPSDEGIEKLVDSLRQMARLGDEQATHVTITSSTCTAWVIAFIRWSLGVPPSIFLGNGTSILNSPSSRVSLTAYPYLPLGEQFQIQIRSTIQNTTDLIKFKAVEYSQDHPRRMSIEMYGKSALYSRDLDSDMAYRAVCQAVPYCIPQVLTNLVFQPRTSVDKPLNTQESKLQLNPFPEDKIISTMIARMLGLPNPPTFKTLETGIRVTDLPVVKLHLNNLTGACQCIGCSDQPDRRFRPGLLPLINCYPEIFLRGLASLIADILALALFEHSESLKVSFAPERDILNYEKASVRVVENRIFDLITSGNQVVCHLTSLFELASSFMDVSLDPEDPWILSSRRGQVIYPMIFETFQIKPRGFLRLSWLPGILEYNKDIYNRVGGLEIKYHHAGLPERLRVDNVSTISIDNLFPQLRLVWWISRDAEGLKAGLAVEDQNQDFSTFGRNPAYALENLSSVFLLESCPHVQDSSVVPVGEFCSLIDPLNVVRHSQPGHVNIVSVHENDRLRLLAISGGKKKSRKVLRRKSCLNCCLNICREIDCEVLIL
jgi:hypothetical protein